MTPFQNTRQATGTPARELPAVPPGVEVITLDNGLTLIIREDHSAPVVSAQAWCHTGSIHEDRWLGAGLSHVLEHMLFKGTTNRPGSRIDQEVQDAGGYMNAYTSFDRTVYWINVPNTGAHVAIDILCDIMQHATLPAEELAKELDVIRREMDMGHDDPGRRSGRRLFETAYTRSPYRYTIIGYPDIFNELKREDIFNYYRDRYVPNNVFFVVVGDIPVAEVAERIRKNYAGSKARALPPMVLPEEPAQTAPRETIEEAAVELGHLHYSWHIPDVRHSDIPVLDVLATLLGSGRSSRLYQNIREKLALVHSADAWTYNPGSPGLFGLSAVVDGDKFEAARAALLAEVERLKRDPIGEAELGKAVKQFVSATLSSRKTMQGQAQDLGGNWLIAQDLNFSERYLATVQAVTPAELQRVARLYLTAENRTLYALLPKGAAPKVATSIETHATHPIQKFTLSNGLRLLIKEDHRLPFVEFRAVFQGGVLAETTANNGITQLLARLVIKGTQRRNAEQIATEIESVGGSLDSFGGNNSFGVTSEVLSSDFATGLDLLSDVILNPTFPAAALEREREAQLAGLRSQRDHMLSSTSRLMRRTLFGDQAYGLDATGTETSISSITVQDLQAFHAAILAPDNCVLAIYGDVNPAQTLAAVEAAFGHKKTAAQIPPRPGPATPATELRHVSEARDKKQAVVVLGFPGVTLQDKDRYALELLAEACSDLGSRLFLRIRDQLGLAYYVGAQNFPGLVPGCFSFYVGTSPEQVELVESELLSEAGQLRDKGLTAEELKRAKAKLVGQKKIARQDLGGLATSTALDELYGLGFENYDHEDAHYEAVTLAQIQSAAQRYLRPETAVVAVLSPG